jgi:ATP-dependent Clp protease ATP-binding subunit ClpB
VPTILNESLPLERYGHNLTLLTQQGAFSSLAGQEEVVGRVFQILQGTKKWNPLILASDETRRWAVVTEVVRRMAIGDAPDPLPKRQVIALDYEALFANLSDDTLIRQERRKHMPSSLVEGLAQAKADSHEAWALLETWIAPTMVLERLQSMFMAMHQAGGSFLLCVDHFHRLVGGEEARYPINATTLVKPALARHQIQLIGACTVEQYRRYIERDPYLQRPCREICLPEGS